nr:hypothetical protein [Nitrosopumilus sp.]
MISGIAKSKAYSQKVKTPNVDSLLKLSLGLVLFTVISTALVYAETISVDVDGTSYDVEYAATGMSVSGIETDLDFVSLILSVDVPDGDGTLDITFERSFFDSVYQNEDDDFIILADGDEPNFTETSTTSQSRTLSITLPSGTEEIEIIGSVFGQDVEETPVEETPVEETPIEETPVEETPIEETPRTECGPRTVLKDGVCTLDETCGPGTILEDGVCVLDSTPAASSGFIKGFGKELGYGVVAAFVIAGAVGIILALMSKASKSSN